jgi:apolipoprotein N-acyltransferase
MKLPPPIVVFLVALVAGAIAALGFEPTALWPLTLVGVTILVAMVDTAATPRQAALLGWGFGVGHFVAGLGWIATAFTFQSKMPPVLGWVTVVLLAMFLALYIGLAAWLARRLASGAAARVLMLAAAWMFGEWLRGWVLSGFAWNPLGSAWLSAPGIAQLAAQGGGLALSGVMLLASGGLWLIVRPKNAMARRLAGGGMMIGVAIAAGVGSGQERSFYYPDATSLFIVQPNIGQDVKYDPAREDAHLETYLELTRTALAAATNNPDDAFGRSAEVDAAIAALEFDKLAPDAAATGVPGATPPLATGPAASAPAPAAAEAPAEAPAEAAAATPSEAGAAAPVAPAENAAAVARPGALVIWSESSVPYLVEEDAAVRARLAAAIGPGDLLLFGGVAANRAADGKLVSLTNSLFVLDAKGKLRGRYDKAHLVPLGEYVPARSLMTALGVARLAPGDLDFKPGPGPRSLDLPGFARVGVQICYEIIFPGAVVDAAKRPGWIVNISNDAWFGPAGPPQHLAQARLRAIEEGLPIARATPTGISAVIDANGRIVASEAPARIGVISVSLPPPLPETLFARFGHQTTLVFGLLLVGLALVIDRRRRIFT